ncbi:MAG: hypothetical protein ABSH01_04160 [Terriglobia bacterium]|jgi:hypothetical protein
MGLIIENILGIQPLNWLNPYVLQTLASQQSAFVDLMDGGTYPIH